MDINNGFYKGGAYAINSFEFPHRNSFGSLYFMATDENDDLTTSKGYFLAGRGLSGIVIGCSMVLTSLSTEQLIGVECRFLSKQLFYYCVDCANGDSALFLGALYVAEIFA